MQRRKFLRNIILFLFAFIFGYTVKKEDNNRMLQRVDSTMVKGKDGKSIADEIKTLTGQLAEITINVKSFGAKGDGIADDTQAIKDAFAYVKTNNIKHIYIPKGTYLIDGEASEARYQNHDGGIYIDFPIFVELNDQATLKIKQNNLAGYNIFTIKNTDNVTIKGGNIVGDLDTHTGVAGAFGFGIFIADSTNITIDGLNISKMWGDSIIIDTIKINDTTFTSCTNITIKNCTFDTNRRQGMSVANVNGLYVYNNHIKNIGTVSGTAPMSGIDIETYPGNLTSSSNIIIKDNYFENNIGADIILSENITSVKITNNFFKTYWLAVNISSMITIIKDVQIIGNSIFGMPSAKWGVVIGPKNGDSILVKDNVIRDFTIDAFASAVAFSGVASNVSILNNTINNCKLGINRDTTSNLAWNIIGNVLSNILDKGIRYAATALSQGDIINNNKLYNCVNTGMSLRTKKSTISGNLIDTAVTGIFLDANTEDCNIIGNSLYNYTNRGVISYTASNFNNYIRNNLFKTTGAIKAIDITGTPAGTPNIISGNVARYSTFVIVADTNCIVEGNYTV